MASPGPERAGALPSELTLDPDGEVPPPGTVRLRFAVLTSGPTIETWLAEAIRRAHRQATATCVAYLTPEQQLTLPNRASSIRQVVRSPKYWGHFLLRRTLLRTHLTDPVPADEVVPDALRTTVPVTQRGSTTRIGPAGLATIRDLDLDFVLLGEFGILKGEVLEVPRYGVWSHHHGDPRQYRGRPSCFWELHDGTDTVSAGIQGLNETLDGGCFMRLATVATKPSFGKTMTALYEASSTLLSTTCHEVRSTGCVSAGVELPSPLPPVQKRPTNAAAARALSRVAQRKAARLRHGALIRRDWEIGIAPVSDGDAPWHVLATPEAFTWLRPSKSRIFWADPFVMSSTASGAEVFVEELDYRRGHGTIVLLRISDGRVTERITVLDDGHHHAFPQVVEHEGRLYATTDSCCDPGVVYSFEEVGDPWAPLPRAHLPPGLTDPVLVRLEDQWLALGSDRSADSMSWCKAYVAQDLASTWRPILPSPLFVDVNAARGGGSFDLASGVRVAQHGAGGYGTGVSITHLDRSYWSGRPRPEAAFVLDSHTVSWAMPPAQVVIDCYRGVVDSRAFVWRLLERAHRSRCSH